MSRPVNPYIAGNPVGNTPAFIGRADVLREVLRILPHPHQNAIVLYGQRRIGKTSVLQHLRNQLAQQGGYVPVYFDLQDKATQTLDHVIRELARYIADSLQQPEPDLGKDAPTAFRKTWLPEILRNLPDNASLVLLFDEFDVLADPQGQQAGAVFFPYLRKLIADDPQRLNFVFVVGRNIDDLNSIALSLFKGIPSYRVSLLKQEETAQLARLSEANYTLRWQDNAVERVWQLTHGHAFLTQQLCSHVWEQAYDETPQDIPEITTSAVDVAITDTLNASRNTLEWLWDGLPPAERIVISALAEAGQRPIGETELEKILHDSGVRIIRELQDAPRLLQDWDLLESADEGYCFRVELLRRWLCQNKPSQRVQDELDKCVPAANDAYQKAVIFYDNNQLYKAENALNDCIKLKPSHIKANKLLNKIQELLTSRQTPDREGYKFHRLESMYVEVFILFSKESVLTAQRIIETLEEAGITAWWDEKISINPNKSTDEIRKIVSNSQCIVMLWSKDSVDSKSFLFYFNIIKDLNISNIIHVRIDNIDIPTPYDVTIYPDNETDYVYSLSSILYMVREKIGIFGPNEHIIQHHAPGQYWDCKELAAQGTVPGTDIFLSFRPCGDSGVFLLTHFDTTDGWATDTIPDALDRHRAYAYNLQNEYKDADGNRYIKIRNDIYFIKDPIRPYSIQIGKIRSQRPNAKPGVLIGDNITIEQIKVLPINQQWMSITLAELLSDPITLQYLLDNIKKYRDEWGNDKYNQVVKVISRNPYSPIGIQMKNCLFCDSLFKEKNRLSTVEMENKYGAFIIANSFPFGPSFHYVVIVNSPIHSWEELTYKDILGVNLITHEFLQDDHNLNGAAGVEFGFNSTVRHLILGSHTRSSAGASIPHIHKQIWGMAPKTSNLAEQLIQVSDAYWKINIDYQKCYLNALRTSSYVLWEDENVALYVPYGQCSIFELQVMTIKPCPTFIDLDSNQVSSISKAEYIALRIYKSLGINSFNHVILSKLHKDTRAPTFRFIETFITREIDLAVSELSMLYVVDQHPWSSRNMIMDAWKLIEKDVLLEIVR